MKILFAALHLAYYRNFDSVVRALAAAGHAVHLTGDEPEGMGGQQLAERLAAEFPGRVTWDLLPSLESEPWFDGARRLRVALDYVRVLDRRYPQKLRLRTEERTARIVRAASRLPLVGPALTRRALMRFERLMPPGDALVAYLAAQAPDLVVLTSLTYSRSQQLDVLKAARSLNIPVAAAIMSWDHLSSKALLHVVPDRVIVWNEVQKREAVEMHGVPADRVVLTGAQCYDQWFTRVPARSREAFCAAMGLRDDRPFVLWVHSALSPTPEPPEPVLVKRWIQALRASADPRLREVGVLVRPHPERLKEWADVSLDGFENVAFHGRNPIDREARDDYFDSLYYSGAVAGLVTSAFLEAAIVGRPVLTFTLPDYRIHQEEMIHFRYLMEVEGGLLHMAPDIDSHLHQLAEALALGGERDERNRRFVRAFVRPAGLDVPATPAFVDALAGLVAEGARPDRSLAAWSWLRSPAMALARASRTGLGRWLMNDQRTDAWDEHAEETRKAVASRIQARDEWHREKARRKAQRYRRELVLAVGKKLRSYWRRARHRTAVTFYRGLYVAGFKRGGLPGGAGKD
ncbi:MAG TPA: hypothetical protein VGQ37_17275 [Vicinamibacterales bacterium]|jgi:hypothetical protein|nr:hypothetical protein [Vicinamibacterales bacterium]